MNLPESLVSGALRISLGKFTSEDDITTAAAAIVDAVRSSREVIATER